MSKRLAFLLAIAALLPPAAAQTPPAEGGWRALPAPLAERIRKNRANLPPAAQEEAWMAQLPPEIVATPDLSYLKTAGFDPRWTSLDVFRPRATGGQRPIVIFVHGGGMSAGDKSPAALVENKARFFPAHGLILVSANYRLAPEATHPVPTRDLAAALAFVRRQAPAWGGDPDALILIGHSAGAQLVVQLVTDGTFLAERGVPASAIRAVISVDAMLYDLAFALAQAGPTSADGWLVRDVVGMTYGTSEAQLEAASPISHLIAGHPLPPMLLFHATDPKSLSSLAAQRFAFRLRSVGAEVEVEPAREKDHSHLGRDIGNPDDWITQAVMSFISRHLPAGGIAPIR
jgi:arylformamidase